MRQRALETGKPLPRKWGGSKEMAQRVIVWRLRALLSPEDAEMRELGRGYIRLWDLFDWDGKLSGRPTTGRPGQWKGRLGLRLLDAIASIRANGAKDTAAAIEILRSQRYRNRIEILRERIDSGNRLSFDWSGYKARYLEKAYVEAKKFWWPYFVEHKLGDQEKSYWFPDTKTIKKNRSCS